MLWLTKSLAMSTCEPPKSLPKLAIVRPARSPMIVMTTRISTRVKPLRLEFVGWGMFGGGLGDGVPMSRRARRAKVACPAPLGPAPPGALVGKHMVHKEAEAQHAAQGPDVAHGPDDRREGARGGLADPQEQEGPPKRDDRLDGEAGVVDLERAAPRRRGARDDPAAQDRRDRGDKRRHGEVEPDREHLRLDRNQPQAERELAQHKPGACRPDPGPEPVEHRPVAGVHDAPEEHRE